MDITAHCNTAKPPKVGKENWKLGESVPGDLFQPGAGHGQGRHPGRCVLS